MRVAALFDIHGNVPALERVLADVRDARADAVVVGGDVLPGPMPRDALQRLRALDIPVHYVYGNGEVAVLDHIAGRTLTKVPQPYWPTIEFVAEQVRDFVSDLARWPLTLHLDIEGLGRVLFCHATPRNEDEIFTRETAEDRLLPVFAGVDAAVVVCGHTHMQFDRMVGPTRVVNAGSVGMPFGTTGADWLLLGHDVQLRHIDYDLDGAAERIRRTAYPWPGDFAAEYILKAPTEVQILEAFARVSI